VIGLRRIGDLLLATPLIHSLKQAWPESMIDVLLPSGTEGIFEGNPDIASTLVFIRGRGIGPLIRRLWRQYDLAVNLQPEDRGHFLALVASARRVSIVPPRGHPGWRWKRWLSTFAVPVDLHQTHAVIQYLQLVDALGLPRSTRLVPPSAASASLASLPALRSVDLGRRYAVVHPSPMYRYKAWPESAWAALVAELCRQGLQVLITGGPASHERELAERVAEASAARTQVSVVSGDLSLAQLAPLFAGASVFVGPDTATTHLAAASGSPTIALFGPSNPCAWAPWPLGCEIRIGSPWQFRGADQQAHNVWLLQGTRERSTGCIPCLREGCENQRDSVSDCLDHLEVSRVLRVINIILTPGLSMNPAEGEPA
jgi:heptosyltransferase-3